MNRRHFLTASIALLASPLIVRQAAAATDYTPGAIANALARGETVFVDYAARWCSTCARQARVVSALRQANPAYNQAITFIRVDWDTYRTHEVTTSRNIPRRSTLLLLRGDQELGRIVAGTSHAQIQGLLDLAL